MGCAGPTNLIHGGSTSQLAGLKGSAANVVVPDTTGHLWSVCLNAAVFGSTRETYTMLGRWF